MRKSLSLFLIAALLLISNVSYVYADTKEKTDTSVSESSNLLEENADIEIVSEDTAIENASDTIEDEPAAEESPDAEEDEAVLEISDISDQTLRNELSLLGGTSTEILENREFMEMLLQRR